MYSVQLQMVQILFPHNHGSVGNGLVISFLSVRIIFHWTMIIRGHHGHRGNRLESVGYFLSRTFSAPATPTQRTSSSNRIRVPAQPTGFGSWSKNPQFFQGSMGYFSRCGNDRFFGPKNWSPNRLASSK